MSIQTILFILSLFGAVLALLKVAGFLAKFGTNIVKWGIYTMLGILILWGIYNQIGIHFGWWDPISLDQFIYKIPVIGDALKKLDDWLNQFSLPGW